jgi:hypothetical protein
MNTIRLLGLGLSFLLLTVLAGVIIVWAAKTTADQPAGPPTEQHSQKIQTPPTPAYNFLWQDPSTEGEDDYECDLVTRGYGDSYPPSAYCPAVNTKAADPLELASITQQIQGGPIQDRDVTNTRAADGLGANVLTVQFNRRTEDWYRSVHPQATSYCFIGKDLALDALGGQLDKAELLGKTDDCFVIVYEGDEAEVKSLGPP